MANRANARKSTGPKTCAGKVRSSRNALRHGFGRPALCVGGYSGEVQVLARDIAGKEASDGGYELGCRAAAAQLDLVQVRLAKRDLQTAANFGSLPGDCDSADHGSPDHGSPD